MAYNAECDMLSMPPTLRQLHLQMEAQHQFLECAHGYLSAQDLTLIQSFCELGAKKGILLWVMLQVLLGVIK